MPIIIQVTQDDIDRARKDGDDPVTLALERSFGCAVLIGDSAISPHSSNNSWPTPPTVDQFLDGWYRCGRDACDPFSFALDVPVIENVAWQELRAFKFVAYPDVLLVTTDANTDGFNKAVELFRDHAFKGDNINIEEALRRCGFAATACNCPDEIQTINL